MSAHRFFAVDRLEPGADATHVPLPDDDVHHAVSVLRLHVGEFIEVVAPGAAASAHLIKLTRVTRSGLWGQVIGEVALSAPTGLSLIQGLIKGEKMDLVVRQATELGAGVICPVTTERSIVRVEGAKAAARCVRWRKIARSAAMQSHAPAVPEVAEVGALDEAVAVACVRGTAIVLSERSGLAGLASLPVLHCAGELSLVVGPEGGLSEKEEVRLEAAGATFASLGTRILRAETAAIAALAIAAMARSHAPDAGFEGVSSVGH